MTEPDIGAIVLALDAAATGPDFETMLAEQDAAMPVSRADQLDAARRDTRNQLTGARDAGYVSFTEYPGWVRLGFLSTFASWLTGQARTCPHNPDPDRIEPAHLAASMPGMVTCGQCTGLLQLPDANSTAPRGCDGCGGPAEIHSVILLGRCAYHVLMCRDCDNGR